MAPGFSGSWQYKIAWIKGQETKQTGLFSPVHRSSHLPHEKERNGYIMTPTQNIMRGAPYLNQFVQQHLLKSYTVPLQLLYSTFITPPPPLRVNIVTFPRDLCACVWGGTHIQAEQSQWDKVKWGQRERSGQEEMGDTQWRVHFFGTRFMDACQGCTTAYCVEERQNVTARHFHK